MKKLIALLGSGEYLSVMDDVDRYLLASSSAGSRTPRVVCLPTAAGQEGEGSWGRWNRMGEEHFRALGADVNALPIIDRESADDLQHAELLENADLIYFSGGDPTYLYQTLNGSKAWSAIQQARARGAVYAGCSAGAMILGLQMPDVRVLGFRQLPAFGEISAKNVIPHFDQIPAWAPMMVSLLRTRMRPGEFSLGIDEDTALIGTLEEGWQVMGRQQVHIITKKEMHSYSAGQRVDMPQG